MNATHRLLRDGEIIQPGDEYQPATWQYEWLPIHPRDPNEAGTGWIIGQPFDSRFFKPIRRKVTKEQP